MKSGALVNFQACEGSERVHCHHSDHQIHDNICYRVQQSGLYQVLKKLWKLLPKEKRIVILQ